MYLVWQPEGLTVDFTTHNRIIEMKSPVICRCPACGRDVRLSQRLSYPQEAIGRFAPVYRCQCGRHVGEPVASYAGVSLRIP